MCQVCRQARPMKGDCVSEWIKLKSHACALQGILQSPLQMLCCLESAPRCRPDPMPTHRTHHEGSYEGGQGRRAPQALYRVSRHCLCQKHSATDGSRPGTHGHEDHGHRRHRQLMLHLRQRMCCIQSAVCSAVWRGKCSAAVWLHTAVWYKAKACWPASYRST